MNRKILIEPDPILRKKCEPLEKVDDNVRKLMKEMLDTMYKFILSVAPKSVRPFLEISPLTTGLLLGMILCLLCLLILFFTQEFR